MATRVWLGGTAAVTQESRATPGSTIEVGDLFLTTLADESGATTTISTAATGTTVAQTCADIQADLAASANALFSAVTWTDETTYVKGLAKNAGIPFHMTLSTTEAGGTAADAQTYVASTPTANAGPNAFDTAANWSGSTVPVADDDIIFNNGSQDLLYDLDQNAIDLKSISVTPGFSGIVGNPDSSFYLKIDCTSTAGGNTPLVNIKTGGRSVWLDGTMTNVTISKTANNTRACRLKGDIDNLRIVGPEVQGKIVIPDSVTLDNLYITSTPNVQVEVGESVASLDLVEMNSGSLKLESGIQASGEIRISGGTLTHTAGAVVKLTQYGGTVFYNGSGKLGTGTDGLILFGGNFDLRNNKTAGVTLERCTVYGGSFFDTGGGNNTTYTNNIVKYGGNVHTDTGQTVSVS